MKKRLIILILTLFFCIKGFSAGRPVVFSAGISSGFPFYGSPKMWQTTEYLTATGGRFIIGTNVDLEFNLLKQFSVFTGADFLCDFNSNKIEYLTTMDLAFSIGVKFYPGLGGLALGLGYSLGTRFDFLLLFPETCEIIEPEPVNSAWGNGIKILIEYNFSHQSDMHFLPTLGCYWRFMPRGNFKYDNILSAYLKINL